MLASASPYWVAHGQRAKHKKDEAAHVEYCQNMARGFRDTLRSTPEFGNVSLDLSSSNLQTLAPKTGCRPSVEGKWVEEIADSLRNLFSDSDALPRFGFDMSGAALLGGQSLDDYKVRLTGRVEVRQTW